MSYIFMDESGDLGFDLSKSKTSKYFIITFLIVEDKNVPRNIVKKIFKRFTKKEIYSHNGVLHAFKEKNKTKEFLLKELDNSYNYKIACMCLDKKVTFYEKDYSKHLIYAQMTNQLLKNTMLDNLVDKNQNHYLIVSKRETNKFINKSFEQFIRINHKSIIIDMYEF